MVLQAPAIKFAGQTSTVRIFSDFQLDAFIIKNRKGSNVNMKLRCSIGRNVAAQMLRRLARYMIRYTVVKSRRRTVVAEPLKMQFAFTLVASFHGVCGLSSS